MNVNESPVAQVWVNVTRLLATADRVGLQDVPVELAPAEIVPVVKFVVKPGDAGRATVTVEPAGKAWVGGAVNVNVRMLPVEFVFAEVGLTVMVPEPLVACETIVTVGLTARALPPAAPLREVAAKVAVPVVADAVAPV